MDAFGRYIATTHQLLGHDKTAALIGAAPGDKSTCVLCRYERNPNDLTRRAVIRALAPRDAG